VVMLLGSPSKDHFVAFDTTLDAKSFVVGWTASEAHRGRSIPVLEAVAHDANLAQVSLHRKGDAIGRIALFRGAGAYNGRMCSTQDSRAPRPRRHARTPAYPTVAAAAVAIGLASCHSAAPQQPLFPPSSPPPGYRAQQGNPIMILAVDPERGPAPRPTHPAPAPEAAFERIEDPAAQRAPVACPGDCPAAFQIVGPAANLEWRVVTGRMPDARSSLVAVHPRVRTCLLRWNSSRRSVNARVMVQATVGADGVLHGMSVRVQGDADGELTTCVANTLHDARFNPRDESSSIEIVAELSRP